MILFLDFEKAFDSLEWGYLVEVLNAMNFGSNFRNWISTFYHNITSCVVNNGYASDFFSHTKHHKKTSILPLLTMRKRLIV